MAACGPHGCACTRVRMRGHARARGLGVCVWRAACHNAPKPARQASCSVPCSCCWSCGAHACSDWQAVATRAARRTARMIMRRRPRCAGNAWTPHNVPPARSPAHAATHTHLQRLLGGLLSQHCRHRIQLLPVQGNRVRELRVHRCCGLGRLYDAIKATRRRLRTVRGNSFAANAHWQLVLASLLGRQLKAMQ